MQMRRERLAMVVTHLGANDRLVELPWLENDLRIDQSDWVILSREGWRSVADGDPGVWPALERKLLIGFYVSQPELILAVGHEAGRGAACAAAGRHDVRRIVRRIRSLFLPAGIAGFWANADGTHETVAGLGGGDSADAALALGTVPAA